MANDLLCTVAGEFQILIPHGIEFATDIARKPINSLLARMAEPEHGWDHRFPNAKRKKSRFVDLCHPLYGGGSRASALCFARESFA
jgi:hypothetical protein